jgi:hypothetical protein
MEDNFVPECFFDTVLVKTILRVKYVNHQKGCSNVVKEIKEGKLKDDFAVGIIDKDKRELDYIKDECIEEITSSKLVLLKHKTKQHYFIQLAPAIEKWILNVADEGNVDMADCGLPSDLNGLKRVTKSVFVNENEKLKNFCKKLVNSNGATITTLTSWMQYLYTHNRNANVEAMRQLG